MELRNFPVLKLKKIAFFSVAIAIYLVLTALTVVEAQSNFTADAGITSGDIFSLDKLDAFPLDAGRHEPEQTIISGEVDNPSRPAIGESSVQLNGSDEKVLGGESQIASGFTEGEEGNGGANFLNRINLSVGPLALVVAGLVFLSFLFKKARRAVNDKNINEKN